MKMIKALFCVFVVVWMVNLLTGCNGDSSELIIKGLNRYCELDPLARQLIRAKVNEKSKHQIMVTCHTETVE